MNPTESAGSNFSGMFASFGAVAANYLQDKMHKKMDTDADGLVGKGEFQAALEKVSTKLGVQTGNDAEAMFASVDADGSGSLTGSEIGQMLKNMFSPPPHQPQTASFVQSRGSEQQFSELDADGDGSISMAEFGISPGAQPGMQMVSTTTTTTTYNMVGDPNQANLTSPLAGASESTDPLAQSSALASADGSATAPLNEDALQALLGNVDSDGDGQISGAEITAFVNQLGSQMQAASQKYNETALAGFSTASTNKTA